MAAYHGVDYPGKLRFHIIKLFLLLTTSLMLNPHAICASSSYTTQTPASISPLDLWPQGVREGKLLKIENSLKNGFKLSQQQINEAFKFLVQHKKRNLIM